MILALITIVLWSFLALLGSHLNHVPPFLLVGLTLTFSGLLGAVRLQDWRVPWRVLVVGVGGIFGYHFLYFSAFRYAPAVETNAINYLWPLLIVLLSPVILPGYPLRPWHIAGAGLGLAGAALIVTGGQSVGTGPDWAHLPGYTLALAAAVTWAIYSLLIKRLPPFPTGAVGGFCLASGLLSLGLYALAPQPVVLQPIDWLYLTLTGLGPMGLAFFTWDAALKRGDPRRIGVLTYLTPLTSTLLLVGVGGRPLSWTAGLALALILAGILVSSGDSLVGLMRSRTSGSPPQRRSSV